MHRFVRCVVAIFARMNLADAIVASVTRYTIVALMAGAAAVCAVASLGCAVAALWIFVLPQVGPVGAPLIAAGVLLALCLAGLALAWRISSRRRRTPPPNAVAEVLLAAATRLLKEQQGTVVLAALVAGLLAGNTRPER